MSQRVLDTWSFRRLSVAGVGLGLITFATFLGLLAAHGYAALLIAALVLCLLVAWAAPRPWAIPVVMLGVLLVPSAAFPQSTFHGIPLQTGLALVTFCATFALWWQRKAHAATAPLSGYSLASLLLLVVVSVVQLGVSRYAQIRPVYQFPLFWASGFLLGSMIAADLRIADRVGLLALPLAILAIFESATGKPSLWSDLVGATIFDNTSAQSADRAASTFGHPLVAGTALVILAFLVLVKPGSRRVLLFSLIVAGAVATVSRSALIGLAAGLLTHFIGTHRQRSQIVGAIAATTIIGVLIISFVPALHASFEVRVLGASTQSEGIRLNSLQELRTSFARSDKELWLGRGLGGSTLYLGDTRGALGFGTYDNQYVTSLYDSGLVTVFVSIGLILVGIIRARPRAAMVAPLAAAAASFFFFEGLYWPVTALLFWMAVGLATARTVPKRGTN